VIAVLDLAVALHAQTSTNWITTYAGVGVVKPGPIVCYTGPRGGSCGPSTIGPTGYSGDGGPATAARLGEARNLAFDPAGNLFVVVAASNRIRKITPDGIISTIAGTGTPGFSGDGGPAVSATLHYPKAVAADANGSVFIADEFNLRVRKIDPNGIITTYAGNGTKSGTPFSGGPYPGPATSTAIDIPVGLALDLSGNLLICVAVDSLPGNRVLRVDQAGTLNLVAEMKGSEGGCGMTVDSAGNIFFATFGQVFKESPDGQISLVAGSGGTSGNSNDGLPATKALLADVSGLAFDAAGNLLMAEDFGIIEKIDSAGIIRTIFPDHKGSMNGADGDFGPAASGSFASDPHGLALDSTGAMYIADPSMARIRKIAPMPASSLPLEVPFSRSLFQITANDSPTIKTGYGALVSTTGTSGATGVAIFGYHANGALVSEAGVPATPLMVSGRVYAEITDSVNTGVALVNPYDTAAQLSFFFTDTNGHDGGNGTTTIAAQSKLSVFLTDAPYNGPSPFAGTFTFTSSLPVGVVALRGRVNERSEYLMTTLPATDLQAPASSAPVVFPQYADGAGWSTEVALVNAGDVTLSGTLRFLDPAGSPLTITVNGQSASSFNYSIPPRSSRSWQTSGAGDSTATGSIVVTPASGQASPVGVSMFAFRAGGVTVTETGVPSTPASTAFRVYAETAGNFGDVGSIQSGFAISNSSTSPATVTISLDGLDGSVTPGLSGTLSIPPGAQMALMLDQLPGIGGAAGAFQKALRVRSTGPVSIVGLRIRVNERGEFLMTTTPPTDESSAPTAVPRFFPHVVDSGGFTTQFILFSDGIFPYAGGLLELFDASGGPLAVNLYSSQSGQSGRQ
jgi:hypothetical protein